MRILANITKIEIKDEFYAITAKDIRKIHHTLFFKEDKWKQIKKEYGCENLIGLLCILEYTENGKDSRFIQTDTGNNFIYTDKG